ncbi:MAG: hypothetical protein LBJ61_08200 [Deltaproteobacteria bacterium]|nr:hypothetical protein [Deltaproteobacteria bacterium]
MAIWAGCASGPLEPGRRAMEARQRQWIDLIREATSADKIYELTDEGGVLPLMVSVLPLNDRVLAEARNRWGTDPRFTEKLNGWLSKGRIVALVGIYTRDVTEEDLLKNNRFRLSIRTNGGLKSEPNDKELLKGSFLSDYFPIFNPWEKVVAVSYAGLWDQNPILVLDCPYGSREISLVQGAKP